MVGPRSQAPVVDVAGLFDGGDGRRAETVAEIARTVERTGVFVATGMPGGAGFDRRARALLRFFDLDEADKRALATQRMAPAASRRYRGYHASRPEARFAYTEYYDVGPDRPMAIPPLRDAAMFAEHNAWPAREPAPGWRSAMAEHFTVLESLGMALLGALASILDLPQREVAARFDDGNSTLRLLRYPPRPPGVLIEDGAGGPYRDPDEPPMAIGRHTDGCCLSLLWQRDPGLQGQGPDGTWYDVPRVADSVSVHLGDMVQTLTAGRLVATPHRVFERTEERCSIGFFLEPKLAASCAPFGSGGHTDRGNLDTYAALLLRRFSRYPGYEGLVHNPDTPDGITAP